MSIILGIDPGSRITGFGVIKVSQGRADTLSCQGYGIIKLNEKAGFPDRMKELGESLQQILDRYKPQVVVIEKIFLGKNADSAFKLGHARGVAMYEAACFGAAVFEYATRVVKKGVTGKGSATKEEVQLILQRLLGIGSIRRLDSSDALALATYHAHQTLMAASIQRALAPRRKDLDL